MVRASPISYARTHGAVYVVVIAVLTLMLIANGVTNIIHWIKIRNSILSWYRGNFNRNYTQKPFSWLFYENTRLKMAFPLSHTPCVCCHCVWSYLEWKKKFNERKRCKSSSEWAICCCYFLLSFFFFGVVINSHFIDRNEANDFTLVELLDNIYIQQQDIH